MGGGKKKPTEYMPNQNHKWRWRSGRDACVHKELDRTGQMNNNKNQQLRKTSIMK